MPDPSFSLEVPSQVQASTPPTGLEKMWEHGNNSDFLSLESWTWTCLASLTQEQTSVVTKALLNLMRCASDGYSCPPSTLWPGLTWRPNPIAKSHTILLIPIRTWPGLLFTTDTPTFVSCIPVSLQSAETVVYASIQPSCHSLLTILSTLTLREHSWLMVRSSWLHSSILTQMWTELTKFTSLRDSGLAWLTQEKLLTTQQVVQTRISQLKLELMLTSKKDQSFHSK